MIEALVLVGGITTHPTSPARAESRYKNRIASPGVIANPYSAVTVGNSTFKTGVIYGTDSVGAAILGSVSHLKLTDNIGFVFGGYNYNKKEFHAKNLESPNFGGITPLIGADISFKLYEGKGYVIESHNILSVITTHSVGIKFEI